MSTNNVNIKPKYILETFLAEEGFRFPNTDNLIGHSNWPVRPHWWGWFDLLICDPYYY